MEEICWLYGKGVSLPGNGSKCRFLQQISIAATYMRHLNSEYLPEAEIDVSVKS
jgi:hypothetical protein